METTWHWQPKKVWEVYNDFRDMLADNEFWYSSSAFVDEFGQTIFRIQVFEKPNYQYGRLGLEVLCRSIAIRPGEMDVNIKRAYQSCIELIPRFKK